MSLLFLFLFPFTLLAQDSNKCELPNLSVGELRVAGEKHLKKLHKEHPIFVLAASAKHCIDCCNFEPQLQVLYDALEQKELPFVRVDLDKHEFMKRKIGVQAMLPALYVVYKGEYFPHIKEWTPKDVLEHIELLQKPITTLTTQAQVEQFLAQEGIKVLGTFYEQEFEIGSDYWQFQQCKQKALYWDFVKWGQVTDQSMIKQMKSQGTIERLNNIIVQRRDGSQTILETAAVDNVDFDLWILDHMTDLVDEFSEANQIIYSANRKPQLILFIEKLNPDFETYLHMVKEVAKEFPLIQFSWIDTLVPSVKASKKDIGLNQKTVVGLAFNLREDRTLVYPEDQPITVEGIRNFVQDFIDNKATPPSKTFQAVGNEELEQAFSNVESINLDQYRELVIGKNQDVMVFFYDTEEDVMDLHIALAKQYAIVDHAFTSSGLQTAKVYRYDLAANTPPRSLDLKGLPKYYFYPANRKKAPHIEFTGEATVYTIIGFFEENADKKFKMMQKDAQDADTKEVNQFQEQVPHDAFEL